MHFAGISLNSEIIFIAIFSFIVVVLSLAVSVNTLFKFIDSSLSFFPKTKRFLQFFYKDVPSVVFSPFVLIFKMFVSIKKLGLNLIAIIKKPAGTKQKHEDNKNHSSAQKLALDLLFDDEDEDIEVVQVHSVNQKIKQHNDKNIEALRRVVNGFSDIKHHRFEGSLEDTQYLKLYLSPKDMPLDKNFEIFSTFIQQWPKSSKQRLIMTDFPSLKEPSFMDVVEGRVNLSRVIRKNLAPNTDVLVKSNINNQVSERKLFSLVSLLKDQYDEVIVLVPEGQELEWQTAYGIFNSEGFVQTNSRVQK